MKRVSVSAHVHMRVSSQNTREVYIYINFTNFALFTLGLVCLLNMNI